MIKMRYTNVIITLCKILFTFLGFLESLYVNAIKCSSALNYISSVMILNHSGAIEKKSFVLNPSPPEY